MAFEAKYRVKRGTKTIGFVLNDGRFYNSFNTERIIDNIDNLKVISNGTFRASKKLPDITMAVVNKRALIKLEKENPFLRDIQDILIKWKENPRRRVMQLEGARQIGKTTELNKFALKNYENMVYVNLADDPHKFGEIITNHTASEMAHYCKIANLPDYVDSDRTILIVDEIQISSEIYNKIRGLARNLNCDIIVTGSYLGQTFKKEFFQPAGTVEYVRMHPLSFGEFCGAYRKREVLKRLSLNGKSNDGDYEELEQLYEIYKKIGGYPRVVLEYKETGSLENAYNVIDDLLTTFERESRNYFQDTNEPEIFSQVYTVAAIEMLSEKRGNGNKFVEIAGTIANRSQNMLISKQEIRRAITWIVSSGVIGTCSLHIPGKPMEAAPNRRTYFNDCGIISYIMEGIEVDQSNKDGLLTETFAYNELRRVYDNAYSERRVGMGKAVLSFSLYNEYELDFYVTGVDKTRYGIEIKTTGGSTKSLDEYLKKKFIDKAVRAMKTKGGTDGDKLTIPIYTVGERFPYR